MTDAYISLDRHWRISYTNPAATEVVRQLVDMKPEEFLGRTHWEIFPCSVGTVVEQEYRRAFTDRVTAHFEILYEPTQAWFEVHAYPSVEGLGIYFRDITTRKEVEEERDRFFNLSLDLLTVTNFEGRFIRVNPAWEQALGFTQAELIAKSYTELVHSEDRQLSIDVLQELNMGKSILNFENRYYCKDGSYRWLAWNATPYVNKNLIYATARDITERKQFEEDRERFFTLSPDLFAVANFDGYLTHLNTSWERILGFSNVELTQQPFAEWIHPEDLAKTRYALRDLNNGYEVISFENRYRCKDGSYRCLSWNAIPYLAQSKIYAIARDVTEQQQLQTTLEERNRELDSFAYVVAHDLKAPLRAIANLSQWIEDDLGAALPNPIQKHMVLLRNRVHKMEATIDGLLNYARIGRTQELIELVSVPELLAEVVDSIAPPPSFKVEIDTNVPAIRTKKILLFQIFSNLISNSIRHHQRLDGLVRVSVRAQRNVYEFAVTDDGPGIAPEYQERIFTIFHAVNPQSRADSTGIGLAIVKKIF